MHNEFAKWEIKTSAFSGRKSQAGNCWQKLDGPQRGQVHPRLIWQDAVGARPSSPERTWPRSFLGCRIAAGPCRSQSRMDGKMGVKSPEKGGKMATFAGTCYVAVYGPTPFFHDVALIIVEKSAES